MKQLEDRIRKEGSMGPGGAIDLTRFLNHCIDVAFLDDLAQALAGRFSGQPVTKVVTVEASGIALAVLTARHLGVPAVVAKKAKADHIEGGLYHREIYSYTYGGGVTLLLAQDSLAAGDHVLLVDDLLSHGSAIFALLKILQRAGASVAGVGIAVEKGFDGGGDKLRALGMQVQSLAIVDSAEDDNFVFRPQD